MKADAEWAAIEAKVSGTDSDFKVNCGTGLATLLPPEAATLPFQH